MSFSTAYNRKKKSRDFNLRSFTLTFICLTCLTLLSLLKGLQYGLQQRVSSEPFHIAQLTKRDQDCRLVRHVENKCAFIKANCQDEQAGLLSYLSLYYCHLPNFHILAFGILSLWLALLFTTIGIAASDFFCINLNTVASILGMSESIVGTTFLALGNGSPDVFSTFAAMNSNSGSLAVGELIGAAAFITAVVAGSMALVREFRVGKKNLVRDVGFFIVAVCLTMIFLADGSLYLWECLVMVGYYLLYVVVVFVWHWYFEIRRKKREKKIARCLYSSRTNEGFSAQEDDTFEEDESNGPRNYRDFEETNILEHGYFSDLISNKNDDDSYDDNNEDTNHTIRLAAEMASNMRVMNPTSSRRNTITPIRPSLVGALEFRSSFASFVEKSRRVNDSLTHCSDNYSTMDLSMDRDRSIHDSSTLIPDFEPLRIRAASFNDAAVAKARSERSHEPNKSNFLVTKSCAVSIKNLEPPCDKRIGLQSQTHVLPSRRSTFTKTSVPYSDYTHISQPSKTRSIMEDDVPAVKILLSSPIKVTDESQDAVNDPSKMLQFGNQHLQVQTPSSRVGSHSRHSSISAFPTYFELQNGSSTRASMPSSPIIQGSTRIFEPSLGVQDRSVEWWPFHYFPNPYVVVCTLFPTLCTWKQKSVWDKFVSIVSAPSIFLLAITLPVVESESPEDYKSREELEVFLESNASSRRPSRRGMQSNASIEARPEWLAYRRSIGSRSNFSLPHQTYGANPHRRSSFDETRQLLRPTTSHSNEIILGLNEFLHNEMKYVNSEDWNRWLVSIQIFTAPAFLVIIFWANSSKRDLHLLAEMIVYSLIGSLISYSILVLTTSPNQVPKYRFILCFLGFLVSIAWISTIASEVVGVLKAIGVILDISDAILGLTIFAVGSSLGDLVADITVARLGFPIMALSACFGGPMFNILLGIGFSGIYVTVSEANKNLANNPGHQIVYKPYHIEVTSTLVISAVTLLITLIGILITVPLNKWVMKKRIGWGLITLWSFSTIANLGLEISGVLEDSRNGFRIFGKTAI